MIALLRKVFIEDFWWKVFALVLAVLIWLTVTFASQKEVGTEPRVFLNLPVTVVSTSEDVRNFKVSPKEVDVVVQGDFKIVQRLQDKDIRVMVDLTGVAAAHDLRKHLEVSVPVGVTCTRVAPESVQVIFPPDR